MSDAIDVWCSKNSKNLGHEIIGTSAFRPIQIFLEIKPPWARQIACSDDYPRALDPVLKKLMREGGVPISVLGMLPKEIEKQADTRRVLIASTRAENSLDYYFWQNEVSQECLVDEIEARVTSEILKRKQILETNETIESIDQHVMVCVHGARDRCCGVFGRKLHESLLDLSPDLDAKTLTLEQVSHIGGHQFAPTIIELPSMRSWGHLSLSQCETLLSRQGDLESILPAYRGCSALAHPYEQFAEKVALSHYSWEWLSRRGVSIRSEWNRSGQEAIGSIDFLQHENESKQPFFRVKLRQSAVIQAQASCEKEMKKSRSLFDVIAFEELR